MPFDQKTYMKQYYQDHKDRFRSDRKKWTKQQREQRNAWQRKYYKNWREIHRTQVLIELGGKCVSCGQGDIRVLLVHHKKGNPERRHLSPKNLADYECLCANCHILAHCSSVEQVHQKV